MPDVTNSDAFPVRFAHYNAPVKAGVLMSTFSISPVSK